MTHDDVARWLDRYIDAWRTYDPAAIRGLFAEDAEYRYYPWGDPLRGAGAIADDWIADQDAPGTWEASYRPFAVEGSRAVAVGTSTYPGEAGGRRYHNVFLLEFDERGNCRSFTEVFAKER